jgi:hypothetical protein
MNSPVLNGKMPPLSSTITAVKAESTHGFNVQRSMCFLDSIAKQRLSPIQLYSIVHMEPLPGYYEPKSTYNSHAMP